ncbi:MAG: DUF1844 domain-containing protein [Planctomycetota bacterium]
MTESDSNASEAPKIIVDSDWKSEAQAEKQRLADAEAKQREELGEDADPNRPVTFMDLVQMLSSQALMYLGGIPDPRTGKAVVAPDVAKLHVDMLGVLEEKTVGNLDEKESELLKGVAYELRMRYVEVSEAVAKAIQEGKISAHGDVPMGPEGAGGGMGGSPIQPG